MAPASRGAERPLPSLRRGNPRWPAPRKGHPWKALPTDRNGIRRAREECGSGRTDHSAGGSRSTDWGGMLRGAWTRSAVRRTELLAPSRAHGSRGRIPTRRGTRCSERQGRFDSSAGSLRATGRRILAHRPCGIRRRSSGHRALRLPAADSRPQRVEQIHREAFARLTPEQRTLVEVRMRQELEPGERPRSSSPDDLARAAGRAEA